MRHLALHDYSPTGLGVRGNFRLTLSGHLYTTACEATQMSTHLKELYVNTYYMI